MTENKDKCFAAYMDYCNALLTLYKKIINGEFVETVVTASSPNVENLVNSKHQLSGKMGYSTATSSGNFNNYIQAKYGVAISHVPPQPKYGVMINPPSGVIQPKYGVVLPGTGQDLNITYNFSMF